VRRLFRAGIFAVLAEDPGSVACITRNELPRRAHMAGDLRLCSMSLGGALFFFVIDMEANKR
jgi:hypothetical protein